MQPKIITGIKKTAQQAKQPLRDLAAYPILTEEVGFSPSPLATPSTGGPGSGGASALGQVVNKAVSDVLGWKIKAGDAKGFVGALVQSFSLTEIEGHVEAKWTPRSYAAQSDLAGGITGAQASVYMRGKEALDQSLPLLDGLYPLDPEADPEDVKALKAVVRSQFVELVNELGFLSGPRVSRVNQYFGLLLIDADQGKFPPQPGPLVVDPDQIGGTLGNLRDLFGLNFDTQDFVNSVQDEQNLSNYRIMADYITSLAQSWLSNLPYFGLDSQNPFFGTQLVLLSRQLQVVAEAVDEVRFTLDSVFIGPAERQTTILNFAASTNLSSIFLEDLLSWIRNFTTEEGPRLIQEGGKFGVKNTFTPVIREVQRYLRHLPPSASATNPLPAGFFAPRVQFAISDLKDQLEQLIKLAKPIKHDITPQPDFGLPFKVSQVESVILGDLPLGSPGSTIPVRVAGNGFQVGATVSFSKGPKPIMPITPSVFFRSESLLVVQINTPQTGTWDVTVVNKDGTSLTLERAFTVTP